MEKNSKLSYLRVYLCAFLMFFAVNVFAQNSTVSGTVLDATGEPVIGATVRVQGTQVATVTDIDGNFKISCDPKANLEISYIGFDNQTVAVNGRGNVNVTMASNAENLDEVVVVGYGVQKKVNVTGAVSMVTSEALEARPVADVSQALQGVIPGLNLSTNWQGGALNNTMSMNVRGTGTIGSGSTDSPLILIDGIEGDINTLNPNDIESVSVLKDAAASSIYGSRAAFGVVLITTKSGQEGKVHVNYSGDVRFSTAIQLPKMVNSLQFAEYFNAASINCGTGQVFSDETMENIKKYMNGEFTDPSDPHYYGTTASSGGTWNNYTGGFANTNWFDEFYKKNVPSTQHNVSISGGTERVNYVVSGGFLNNNGLIKHGKDRMNRYNVSAKIGAQLASWARMEYTSRWARKDYSAPQYMQYYSGLFFHNIARRWPTCFVKDPNGNYADGMEINELEYGGLYKTINDELTQKLRAVITPLKGWNITAEGALVTNNYRATTNRIPVYAHNVDNVASIRNSDYGTVTYVSDQRSRSNYYAINVFTDYTFALGLNNFKALAGVNYEKWDNDYMTGTGKNLTTETAPYLSQAQDSKTVTDAYWHRATAGYFGRLNWDYDGRYLAEFNLRYDGSSRFLADKRWAWFPSVSVGWNIAREKFFQNLNTGISTLKLRASWGTLGNTSAAYSSFSDYYPFFQQQAVSSETGTWLINGKKQNVASLPGIINSVLTWETIESLDFGLDLSAFNGRLNGSFDWFQRTTKDMVAAATAIGSILGASNPNTNNADLRTRGWEVELSWRDRIGQVGYNVRVNVSDSKSVITRYPFEGAVENQSIYSYYNGKNLGEIWGFTTKGIAQSDEEMNNHIASANQDEIGSKWGAGDVMYEDLDGDGSVSWGGETLGDHGDLKVIGNTTPRYRFGINLGLDWKGIDFSMFWQGVAKRDWSFGPQDPYFWGATGNMWQSACFEEHLDYWSESNPDAYYPKPYLKNGGQAYKNQVDQTRYLQNAAYMRLKNIQLGYTLPANFTRKAGISNLRIYASCDNLFTITSLSKVFDPETIDGGWGQGKTYPLQRTWAIGVSMNLEGSGAPKKAKEVVYQPQVVEKVVEKIVEKPVEKIVEKVVTKEVVKENLTDGMYVVNFAQGSAKVDETAELNNIPEGSTVEIVAYASPEGNPDANQALSQKRADNIAKYLQDRGVKVERAVAKGANSKRSNRIAIVTVK